MHMTFYWTTDVGEFFFDGVNINSVTSLVVASVVVALFSILYEGIKVYSAYARARIAREQIAAVSCAPSESANLLVTETNNTNSFGKRFCRLINETIVFLMHNTIGYAVMLSVMLYSGWLFLAVVLSMGLGYFFFGHISMKVNMESIQARTTKIVCSPGCAAEAGNSGNSSKTPSPCRSMPNQANEPQCATPCTTTITAVCHDNRAMCETQTSKACHEENETTQTDAEENCSCRL